MKLSFLIKNRRPPWLKETLHLYLEFIANQKQFTINISVVKVYRFCTLLVALFDQLISWPSNYFQGGILCSSWAKINLFNTKTYIFRWSKITEQQSLFCHFIQLLQCAKYSRETFNQCKAICCQTWSFRES